MHCILGTANVTASCKNVRLNAGISTLTVSQWIQFLNQTHSFAKIECETEMCTQQHTDAVKISKYTEPKNQSPTFTKLYAQGHKQYGTSNNATLKTALPTTVYSSTINIQKH